LSPIFLYKNVKVIEMTFANPEPQSSGHTTLVKRTCVGSGRSRDAARNRRLREHTLVRFLWKLSGPPPSTRISRPGWWSSYRQGCKSAKDTCPHMINNCSGSLWIPFSHRFPVQLLNHSVKTFWRPTRLTPQGRVPKPLRWLCNAGPPATPYRTRTCKWESAINVYVFIQTCMIRQYEV